MSNHCKYRLGFEGLDVLSETSRRRDFNGGAEDVTVSRWVHRRMFDVDGGFGSLRVFVGCLGKTMMVVGCWRRARVLKVVVYCDGVWGWRRWSGLTEGGGLKGEEWTAAVLGFYSSGCRLMKVGFGIWRWRRRRRMMKWGCWRCRWGVDGDGVIAGVGLKVVLGRRKWREMKVKVRICVERVWGERDGVSEREKR